MIETRCTYGCGVRDNAALHKDPGLWANTPNEYWQATCGNIDAAGAKSVFHARNTEVTKLTRPELKASPYCNTIAKWVSDASHQGVRPPLSYST